MPLFQRQAAAKRRSAYLISLYILSLLATVTAATFLTAAIPTFIFGKPHEHFIAYILLPFCCLTLLVLCLTAYRRKELQLSGAKVAESLGGTRIELKTATFGERRLLNIVSETALAASLPCPTVYVLQHDHSINAFAAGTHPRNAVIGITRGALDRLGRDSLQAVIAHEFSHIANNDIKLDIKLCSWLYGLQGIAGSGRLLVYGHDETDTEYRRRQNVDTHPVHQLYQTLLPRLPTRLIGRVLLCVGAVGNFCASALQAAVSRQREFLADAAAVQYTRQTQPLIDALCLIARENSHLLHSRNTAQFAHMLFGSSRETLSGSLTDSHPPIIKRIRRLDPEQAERLAPQLQEWESIRIYSHKPNGVSAFQTAGEEHYQALRQEEERNRRKRMMADKIRRYRHETPVIPPLPQTWQSIGYDERHAAAALIQLLHLNTLPENLSEQDSILLIAKRMSAQQPLSPLYALETLLPALVTLPENELTALRRELSRHHSSNLASTHLILLAQSYLNGTDRNKPLPENQPRPLPENLACLPPDKLQTAFARFTLLPPAERHAALQHYRQTLSGSHPVLWRLLCIHTDTPTWASGSHI